MTRVEGISLQSDFIFASARYHRTGLKILRPSFYVTFSLWRRLSRLSKFQFHIHVSCWSMHIFEGEPSIHFKERDLRFLDIFTFLLRKQFFWESWHFICDNLIQRFASCSQVVVKIQDLTADEQHPSGKPYSSLFFVIYSSFFGFWSLRISLAFCNISWRLN